jgi:hypothetical protein
MAIITRTIQNTTSSHADITLLVPGYNTEKTPVVIPWNTTVDLFTVMTGDQLEAIQTTLAQYLSLGQIAVIATVDTATFNPVGGGGSGVTSLHADGGSALTGAIQLISGTNVTLTEGVGTITISSSGGGVTDPLRLSNGTSDQPSYSFTADTGTGMYLIGVNALGFAVSGLGSPVISMNSTDGIDVNTTLNMNSNPLINLIDPTNPQDAATKNYVDTHGGSPVPNIVEGTHTGEVSIASATYITTGLTATLTASSVSAIVEVTVSGTLYTGSTADIIELALAVDGTVFGATPARLYIQGNGTSQYMPFSFSLTLTPGDTNPHAYALYALITASSFTMGESGVINSIIVQEIH